MPHKAVTTTVERTVPEAFPLPTAGCISLQSPLAYIYEASVIRAVIATSTHTRLDECKDTHGVHWSRKPHRQGIEPWDY